MLTIIQSAPFPVKLIRKPIKNINLRIHRDGTLHLSAPMKLPIDSVFRFLEEKRPWIEKHQARIFLQASTQAISFQSGEFLFFLGQPYEILVQIDRVKRGVELNDNLLFFYVRENDSVEKKSQYFQQWLLLQMQLKLPDLCHKWESVIGVKPSSYVIKSMRSRWGSCEVVKKKICLNLRLMKKPLVCLEYVIVHELVHLLEASHNRRFHALMTQYMPEWKEIKKKLKENE